MNSIKFLKVITSRKSHHFAPAIECKQRMQFRGISKLSFVHFWEKKQTTKQKTTNHTTLKTTPETPEICIWKLLPLPNEQKLWTSIHTGFFCFPARYIQFAHKAAEQFHNTQDNLVICIETNTNYLIRWSSLKANKINQRYHRSARIPVIKMLLRLENILDIPATWCSENNLMCENSLKCS